MHEVTRTHPSSQQWPLATDPGGGSRSVSHPVDDIHQVRIKQGVLGSGMKLGEEKRGIDVIMRCIVSVTMRQDEISIIKYLVALSYNIFCLIITLPLNRAITRPVSQHQK